MKVKTLPLSLGLLGTRYFVARRAVLLVYKPWKEMWGSWKYETKNCARQMRPQVFAFWTISTTFFATKPAILPRLCHKPRCDSQPPMLPRSFRYWDDFALNVLLSSLFYVYMWVNFTGSWTLDVPFFFSTIWQRRWGSNQRPQFIISHPACDAIVRK